MEPDTSKPVPIIWKLPLYLGKGAIFGASVPFVMLLLCIITGNPLTSLIDLYYCFVTPFQICKWSIIFTLSFSFLSIVSASLIYFINNRLHWDEFRSVLKLSFQAIAAICIEVCIYVFFIVVFMYNTSQI